MNLIKKGIRVVVLGAGITGLSVAHTLSSNGVKVYIIEKDNKVGGIIKGFKVDGYTFDHGPHAILTRNKAAFEQFKHLIKDDLMNIGERKAGIYFRGRYYQYPLKPTTVFRHSSILLTAKMLFSFVYCNLRRAIKKKEANSFDEYLIGNFGKELYRHFFENYTKKVWGVEPSKLAASFAAERIPKLSLLSFVRETLNKKRAQLRKADFSEDLLYYPKNGVGQIAELLEKEIRKNNGVICLNSAVKRINIQGSRVKSVEFLNNGKKHAAYGDYFVSTIPITIMVKAIHPRRNSRVLDAAKNLRYKSIKFLFVVVNKEKVLKDKWVYFHDEDCIFYRMFDTSLFSRSLMPKGKTGLIIELSTAKEMSDNEYFEASVRDLEKYSLARREDIEAHFFDELEHGYPVYSLHYKENLETIFNDLTRIKNLIPAGRQGLFRYLDMDHCIRFGPVILEIISSKKGANVMDSIIAEHGKKTY